MSGRSTCPSGPDFFGLGPSDQDIFLEPAFLLMYYGGFSFTEAWNLPVTWRRWFIERINAEFEKSKGEEGGGGSRGAHQNTPDVRQLQGMARAQTPSRLRRFT